MRAFALVAQYVLALWPLVFAWITSQLWSKRSKKVCSRELFIFANEENDCVKQLLELPDWETTNASMEQQIAALADREKLKYAGLIAFVDPVDFGQGIKAHMVRPHGVHVAKRLSLTVGGGEQTFNLGNFVLSAEWVGSVKPEIARAVLTAQREHLQSLVRKPLEVVVELDGPLSDAVKQKNFAVLRDLGFLS
jgi:hypothetical protein